MATEERLIDANYLVEELISDRDQDSNRYMYWYQKEERDSQYNFAIDRIKEAPTVDAVKVVRCKYCKFSKPPSAQVQKYGVPGSLRCENRNSPSNHRLVFGNGYCPYGERNGDND